MHLTATTSKDGEVAQRLSSATSEWGLGREARAASMLKVRTRPECPEENLRELIWDSNPNCGITRKTKTNKQTFPAKGSNTTEWPLTHSQNKGLGNNQRRASQLLYRALPPLRQRGRCATARARRQGAAAIPAPETASSTKLWSGSQILIMSYRDPVWITSARNVTAWHQHPRGDTQHTWDCALMVHPGNRGSRIREVHKVHDSCGTVHSPSTWSPEWLGPGKGTKCTAYLGLCPYGAPENVSSLDLWSAWNAGLTWGSALAEHTGAWAVWTQEVHAALGCGKLSVVHPLRALLTHASSTCLQCPSLPTTQLNKWA